MDYEQIREAYEYTPQATPLDKLDRSTVLASHVLLTQRERRLEGTGQVRTRTTVIGEGKHWSRKSVEQLEVTTLADSEIRCDEVAKGRVLLCRIMTEPIRTTSVQFVVEDTKGLVLPISLFHVPARFGNKDLQELYPIGACFAVKEPFIRSNRDGHYLRIESPSDLIRLFPNSPLLRSLPTFISKYPLSGRSVEDCKQIGNKAFQSQRWHVAQETYTWALALLPSQTSATEDASNITLRATLLSNLALTNLKLSLPSSAKRQCLSALSLFPPSVFTSPSSPLETKLLYRLSLSHYALQDYSQCISTLTSLLSSTSAPNAEASALLDRARSRLLEQTQASYDFPSLFSQAQASPGVDLDVADYFARDAIEVKEIKGKGRGLVAKRRIERGEVLIVCKPLAWAGVIGSSEGKGKGKEVDKEKRTQYLVGVNLLTKTSDPWATIEVVAELAWRTSQGEEGLNRDIGAQWAGKGMGRLEYDERAASDPSRLEGVVTFNGFYIEDLASSIVGDSSSSSGNHEEVEEDRFNAPTALYPTHPSMLNHSCLPNTSYTFISNLFILRARTYIEEGEELVDSYVNSLDSLGERTTKLEKHGFVCRCELCEEERGTGSSTRSRRQDLVQRIQRNASGKEADVESLERLKLELEKTWESPSRSRQVRPALYSATRQLAQVYADRGDYELAVRTETEGLRALGAIIEVDKTSGEGRLSSPPLVGDTNAVLSALWISKTLKAAGQESKSRSWIRLAMDIEKGQAGKELFELRHRDWAKKHNLDLAFLLEAAT